MSGKSKITRETAIHCLGKLARAPVNDAVKLAFLTDGEQVDGLRLDALAEFRRNDKGVVEVKLVDRAAIWRELAALTDQRSERQAEQFFRSLEE